MSFHACELLNVCLSLHGFRVRSLFVKEAVVRRLLALLALAQASNEKALVLAVVRVFTTIVR